MSGESKHALITLGQAVIGCFGAIAAAAITGLFGLFVALSNHSFSPISTSPAVTPSATALAAPAGSITGLVLAREVANTGGVFQPNGVTNTFAPDQARLNAVVSVRDLATGSVVKIVWTTVEAAGGTQRNVVLNETELKANGTQTLYFWLNAGETGFAIGTYRVDAYVNGVLMRSQTFDIVAQIQTPIPTLRVIATTAPTLAVGCPPLPPVVVTPSGLINNVTLALGADPDSKAPKSPTNVFSPQSTFHAIVATKNAAANTAYRVSWFTMDVGQMSLCNTPIDSTSLVSEGTRNIDFSLTPITTWYAGRYRVEIYVNEQLDRALTFEVK